MKLAELYKHTIQLCFPHYCISCDTDALDTRDVICARCMHELPYTNYESQGANKVEQIFKGRLNLQAASASFYFAKGNVLQHLLHELKYKKNRSAGLLMGELMGEKLLLSERFKTVDLLIPLPLFARKQERRGYNQSEIICKGIQMSWNLPMNAAAVIRKLPTETQTKKHRSERWENVAESFHVKHPEQLVNKHVLLIDDVLTTGATFEACGKILQEIPGLKLSLASVALASK